MKSIKRLLMAIALGSTIAVTGCTAQKTQQTTPQAASSEKAASPINQTSESMRSLLKDMKSQLSNKEEDKISEGGTKLEESWKQFEDKFEDDLKDKYLDLYVKIEDPLEIIEAAAKVKPLDTNVLNTSIDQLDKELIELEKRDATTEGLENMKTALNEMNTQLNNKEEDKAIKTSDKLEENWQAFEDTIKESYKDLYDKVETPLGTIQAAVKVTPLDTKALSTSINDLNNALDQIEKSIAFASAPQDMKTALNKINKFLSPLKEDKIQKYAERLEKYWSSIEDTVKAKNPTLYEKVESPLGIIEAGAKISPIDVNTLKTATESLDKVLTEVQTLN